MTNGNNDKPAFHPVYTVTNIKNNVRALDGKTVTYSTWVRLFKHHATGYDVITHIDGSPPPASTDTTFTSWRKIDSIVLTWIYGTLSNDILSRVLVDTSTAREAWVRVENIFTNNKGARAAALEQEFNTLKLENMPNLEAYCDRLRELAGMLKDVDSEVPDRRLVIQLVLDLPRKYSTVAAYINQTTPSFETARSMLDLEQSRQSAVETPTALAAPAASPTLDPDSDTPYSPRPTKKNNGKKHHKNRPGHHQSRPNNQFRSNQRPPQWGPLPSWSPTWSVPPCPYPTQSGWVQQWSPRPPRQCFNRNSSSQQFNRGLSSQNSNQGQAYVIGSEEPTDLNQSFQGLSFNDGSDSWYMDTSASSHLTADQGYSEWDNYFEE